MQRNVSLRHGMKHWMASLVRGQSGEGIINGLYIMFILAVLLFVAVEVASYSMSVWKMYSAAEDVMEMMKSQNGLDHAIEYRFREMAKVLRLDDMDVRLEGTPKTVQRGDMLALQVHGRYQIKSLRPFGQELSIAIRLRLYGLAHTYIRPG